MITASKAKFPYHMISVWNCFRKRTSFSENKRRSRITYFKLVILSIPIPKAKPVYFLLSMPQFSKTLGSTMPQPSISTQPVYLHILQPEPPQMVQLIIHFGRWLGEREIGGPETYFGAFAVKFLHKVIKRLLQIGKGNIFIDIQTLYLVKKAMRTRRNGLVTVNPARHNGPERRLAVLHHPHLYR